jgi:anti-sigma-K factor RskA
LSARDHSTIEELLAVRALGGLDGKDEEVLNRELTSHGNCDRCRWLEAEFTQVVGRLGLSLDPVPVDPGMADRIIASTGATQRTPEAAATVELSERRGRRGRRWAVAVAIAAVFALVVGGVAVFARGSIPAVPLASGQQVVLFSPTTAGTLAMAYTPGQPGVLLWGSGMKDPGTDKVYEVWMIANGTPVSGGCVRPTDGDVVSFSNTNLGDATQMAVTIESSSCPSAPTTTPIMTAALTA